MAPSTAARQRKVKLVVYAVICVLGLLGYGEKIQKRVKNYEKNTRVPTALGLSRVTLSPSSRLSPRLSHASSLHTSHAHRPPTRELIPRVLIRPLCAFVSVHFRRTAFLLALHEAGTTGDDVVLDGGEHADFLSRENYQRHRPRHAAAFQRANRHDSIVQRLERDTWGMHHHSAGSAGSAGNSGSAGSLSSGVTAQSSHTTTDREVSLVEQRSSTEEDDITTLGVEAGAATTATEVSAMGGGAKTTVAATNEGGDGAVDAQATSAEGDNDGPVDPSLFPEDADDGCHANEHTEYWGALSPGVTAQGANNKQPTAAACCSACKEAAGATCNAWVWDPTTRECWLKKLANAYQPANINPNIRFTSGTVYPEQPLYEVTGGAGGGGGDGDAKTPAPAYCLHTMITSNGQPYMNWQTRVFYATWKKVAKAGAPATAML